MDRVGVIVGVVDVIDGAIVVVDGVVVAVVLEDELVVREEVPVMRVEDSVVLVSEPIPDRIVDAPTDTMIMKITSNPRRPVILFNYDAHLDLICCSWVMWLGGKVLEDRQDTAGIGIS
jgi:hypothetical protein